MTAALNAKEDQKEIEKKKEVCQQICVMLNFCLRNWCAGPLACFLASFPRRHNPGSAEAAALHTTSANSPNENEGGKKKKKPNKPTKKRKKNGNTDPRRSPRKPGARDHVALTPWRFPNVCHSDRTNTMRLQLRLRRELQQRRRLGRR